VVVVVWRYIGGVQTTRKIPGDGAVAFADYLTSCSGRGDYYVGEDGEPEPPVGCWHGRPGTLRGLGIDPEGPVGRGPLLALMRGVSPATGEPLRRAGADGSRVAGIDLTFSAPKSVSALWAVSGAYRRAQIEAAHRKAVESAIGRVERDVQLVRRRREGRVVSERARALVAAEFVHTASRLTRDQERNGGVPDPQLHSHVLVLCAERIDGRLAAADSRALFRSARVNGAWYRAELAARLMDLGLEVRGRTGKDRRYFELKGVPEALSARWSARSEDIRRAAIAFRQRYGREPRGGELGAITTRTRGAKTITSTQEVDGAWRAVGEEHDLGTRRAERLFDRRERLHERHDLAEDLLEDVCRERATVETRDLHARALELSTGVCRPQRAMAVVDDLAERGELVELEGDRWTTRELRELERRSVEVCASRARDTVAPVGREALQQARARAEGRLGARLSGEQEHALDVVAGRGGVTGLVGQAGTGKGVVIATARDAWESEGHRVLGTAVAGATAKRLGADTGIRETLTTDALLHRANNGRLVLDERTVVVMDEAGMADTRRLSALIDTTRRSGSKLMLVGDEAQLSSIGAGGLFATITERVPAAELTEVHRAREEWEREAWTQVRAGDSERALAAYRSRERLHVSDTRLQARGRIVEDWDRARREHPAGRTVILTDASNAELDELNAAAQSRRALAGELGDRKVELPGRPYDLHAGDDVIFTGQLYEPGAERVENGTRAQVTDIARKRVTLRTEEPEPRDIAVDTRAFDDLRLAYAQHVYKAQGATVERAFVLCGGWQTDRERAYVALTRARERTDVYVCRDDLGEEGMDDGAIERLAERIAVSRAQQPSVVHRERDRSEPPPAPERESEVGRVLRQTREQEQERERSVGEGLGL
jgi:conjugative relaxase-like TrwC/TraI family protein